MLLTGNHASEDELKAIDKEIKAIVNDVRRLSPSESPEPDLVEELWTDIIYACTAESPEEAIRHMATEILMPALSPTMEEGTLAKWLVKEGDTVASGDILAEIETDKATMEFEAVDEGTIGKILIEEGTEGVKVNTPIAVLLEEGESADDIATTAASAPTEAAPAAEAPAATASAGATPAQPLRAQHPTPVPDWAEGTEMVNP